jgi:hypothetical protein
MSKLDLADMSSRHNSCDVRRTKNAHSKRLNTINFTYGDHDNGAGCSNRYWYAGSRVEVTVGYMAET